MASTQHPQALDAFVSILFAPMSQLSFEQMLQAMQCPVCMVYGREDPWVVPLWGQRLKRLLPDAVYLEVSRSLSGSLIYPDFPWKTECLETLADAVYLEVSRCLSVLLLCTDLP